VTSARQVGRWRELPRLVGAGIRPLADDLRGWVGRPWEQRGTQTYVTILSVTSLWTATASNQLASTVLRHASTNLQGLAHRPLPVLVSSAMWTEPGGWRSYLLFVGIAVTVLAPIERRLGTVRWTVAFVAGHVGATLLTAAGLWLAVDAGWLDESLSRAIDVGWSYGTFAVAATGTRALGPATARRAVAVLVVWCVAQLARHQTFTDVGHLLAVAIGLAVAPFIAGRRPIPAPDGRTWAVEE
jgi:hypothetical protein